VTRAGRAGDAQPMPTVNDAPDIQSVVIADIEARRAVGIERYGTALQPHNGRDALVDAYEEAVDLAMYLRQRLVEQDTTVPRPRFLLDAHVVVDAQAAGPWGRVHRVHRTPAGFSYDICTGSVSRDRYEHADLLLRVGEARLELADVVLDRREAFERMLREGTGPPPERTP
jgi:hypothetical protein